MRGTPRIERRVLGVIFGLALLLAGAAASSARAAEVVKGKELTITWDGVEAVVEQASRPLLRYRTKGKGRKPYVLDLTTPAGVTVLRDAPADHLHHHGLMFACRVNGVNFWEEPADSGRQVHQKWLSLKVIPGASGEAAVLTESLSWQSHDGKVLLEEQRVLTAPARRPSQVPVLTWQTTLKPPASLDTVTLTGAVYHGLGCRFPGPMDVGGRFQTSAGMTGRAAKVLGTRAAWCAYTAEPSPGKPVTVAILDARSNPRPGAKWYTKDDTFAYLSATLGLDVEALKVTRDRPLTLRYGVAAIDGAATKATLDAAHAGWRGQ